MWTAEPSLRVDRVLDQPPERRAEVRQTLVRSACQEPVELRAGEFDEQSLSRLRRATVMGDDEPTLTADAPDTLGLRRKPSERQVKDVAASLIADVDVGRQQATLA